ncbi:class I SAM-dependent methyltransferase [Agrobacterium tumefaciens]|uniref:class I SAM-dependent methyltransferase n=1 Tax=Agrobacterium tumefaciens TaxID=358 RepID=UPI001571BF23|nr:class I SAM-dependent methyltransferase [Agrobacterium tumefaciens]NSZ71261.1 class I SAM-dependent methyltransferase [Agrobacterium tumefaciens]
MDSASYWSAAYFDTSAIRSEWQAHPMSLARLYRLQGGDAREDWFFKKYLLSQPVERAASVGAGRAETEVQMILKGHVQHFDLYDISPDGIDSAKATLEKYGLGDRITCHVVTPGVPTLPKSQYDLVLFVASLHHMPELPKTLISAVNGLRVGGHLWCVNEYVGPDRFYYPVHHVEIAARVHSRLPAEFRKHQLDFIELPTPEQVATADPSEAPTSSQILPTMRAMFPSVDVKELYGAFAFIIFWGLQHDALYDTEEGRVLVRHLLEIDEVLAESRFMPSYFAHIVVRRPKNFSSLSAFVRYKARSMLRLD